MDIFELRQTLVQAVSMSSFIRPNALLRVIDKTLEASTRVPTFGDNVTSEQAWMNGYEQALNQIQEAALGHLVGTCTRHQPHDGPCNGFPCEYVRQTYRLNEDGTRIGRMPK